MNQHDIIKDLIPSYIDGITSDATNQLVADHLKSCPECRAYYEEMQQLAAPDTVTELKKIEPLKKVRKVNRRKIILAVISTLLVAAAGVGAYFYYYGQMWLPKSTEVTTTIEKVGNVVELEFSTKKSRTYLVATRLGNKENVYGIYEYRKSPLDPVNRRNGYIGYTFVDEDTIYVSNGKTRDLTDDDVLTIQFADKTEKIKIKDLYDGKIQ